MRLQTCQTKQLKCIHLKTCNLKYYESLYLPFFINLDKSLRMVISVFSLKNSSIQNFMKSEILLTFFLSVEKGKNAFTERLIVVWNVFRHNLCKNIQHFGLIFSFQYSNFTIISYFIHIYSIYMRTLFRKKFNYLYYVGCF